MKKNKPAGPADKGAVPAQPPNHKSVTTPETNTSAEPQLPAEYDAIIDFAKLRTLVPLCDRALRQRIREGVIPSILLPNSRKRLFHLPSVQSALLRHQVEAA